MVSARSGHRPLFDDQSTQLDRFGLLLLLTVTSIVCLSLVDLDPSSESWLAQTTAAVSVYLLIPVAFFYLSVALDHFLAPTFFGRDEPTTSFMYFSLSTLTTVG